MRDPFDCWKIGFILLFHNATADNNFGIGLLLVELESSLMLLSFSFLSAIRKQKRVVKLSRTSAGLLHFFTGQVDDSVSALTQLFDDFIF